MISNTKYAELPNPFDFANPITNPNKFVGRNEERKEIEYYLNHAEKVDRPINLAILGDRASGKTSLLNLIENEGTKRKFCVVRVDLDEGDIISPLHFFYKLFDAMISKACSLGAYEGMSGKTYEIYREMVDSNEVPADKTFCPFVFPIQYALAMKRENQQANLSDNNFKDDLKKLREQIERPILVIFDEGDVIGKSRVILEKLRNIFMAVSGYMLVISGTRALFPVMDEVFSPIGRQFKKITIGPFETFFETEECIARPLKAIGISDTLDLIDKESIEEIHEISRGQPYEVQLVCHILFRGIQDGITEKMQLTLGTLEDIRNELESAQDVSERPVISAVKNFNEEELRALAWILPCNGRATFEQLWFAEYVLRGTQDWTEQKISEKLRQFEDEKVVTSESRLIKFIGDDFDRIYCKYLAKEQDIPLYIDDHSFDRHLGILIGDMLTNSQKTFKSFPEIKDLENLDLNEIAINLGQENLREDMFPRGFFLFELYLACIEFCEKESFAVASISINSPWGTGSRLFRVDADVTSISEFLSDLHQHVEPFRRRAEELQGDVVIKVEKFPVVPLEKLAGLIAKAKFEVPAIILGNRHMNEMSNYYLNEKNLDKAIFNGELAFKLYPTGTVANNLGYLCLISKKLSKARMLFELAIEKYQKPEEKALPQYNLGVVDIKEGKFEKGIENFKKAMEILQEVSLENRKMGCLLVPKVVMEKADIEFEEVKDPDLLNCLELGIECLKNYLSQRS